jgi:hypothetical protein
VGEQDATSPHCNCDTGIIATWEHQTVVKILEGVDLSLGDLGGGASDVRLKLSDFDLL